MLKQLSGEATIYSGMESWPSCPSALSRSVSVVSDSLCGIPIFLATSLTKLIANSGCACVSALKEKVTYRQPTHDL